MKKISKKDLSLQRETVSSLSNENSGDIVENTISCNISLCKDCPTATFATVCTPCETGGNCHDTGTEATCQATESNGPVCCPPDPPVNLSDADPTACLLTGDICQTKNICLNTNATVCNCDTNAECGTITISIKTKCFTKPCP